MSRSPSPRQLRRLRKTIKAKAGRLNTFDQFEALMARQLNPPPFSPSSLSLLKEYSLANRIASEEEMARSLNRLQGGLYSY